MCQILDHRPLFFCPVGHFLYMHNLSESEMKSLQAVYYRQPDSWANRIGLLAETLSRSGILGPEDEQINQVIWNRHIAELQQDPEGYQEWAENFSQRELGDQLRYFASVRNGMSLEIDGIRQELKHTGVALRGREAARKIKEKISRLDIKWIESPHHPLNHLYPTIGYEVESSYPMDRDMRLYLFLNSIGFRKGAGGGASPLEASPGPFYRPETATLVYLLWVQAGLIDFYREYGQTFHSNLGVHLEEGMPELVIGLMSTGFAWQPIFEDPHNSSGRDTWSPRIYCNMGVARNHYDNYIESKDFDALTVSGTVNHLHLWSHLGAALKSYQKALLILNGFRFIEEFWSSHHMTPAYATMIPALRQTALYPQAISEMKELTADEKKLARVWQDYSLRLHLGFRSVGLDGIWVDSGIAARRMGIQVLDVLPDIWSRYSKDPANVETRPVEAGGRRYANLVHFARSIAWQANGEAVQILKGAEKDFVRDLRDWHYYRYHGGNEHTWVRKMRARFDCGVDTEDEYVQVLHQAAGHYL